MAAIGVEGWGDMQSASGYFATGEAAVPARAPWWRRGVRNGVGMGVLALAAIVLLNAGDLPGLGRVLAELPAGSPSRPPSTCRRSC